jgi:hypothetical protein
VLLPQPERAGRSLTREKLRERILELKDIEVKAP